MFILSDSSDNRFDHNGRFQIDVKKVFSTFLIFLNIVKLSSKKLWSKYECRIYNLRMDVGISFCVFTKCLCDLFAQKILDFLNSRRSVKLVLFKFQSENSSARMKFFLPFWGIEIITGIRPSIEIAQMKTKQVSSTDIVISTFFLYLLQFTLHKY